MSAAVKPTDWDAALEQAKKDQDKFLSRGEKIVKRYRDERTEAQGTSGEKRYNILWSNVKTTFPAVYSRKPKAQVERRYKDADPVARTASQILERALQYEIDHYPDYDSALRGAVLDRLLPGRGVAWVRFDAGDQVTDDVQSGARPDEPDAPIAPTLVPAPTGPLPIGGEAVAPVAPGAPAEAIAPPGLLGPAPVAAPLLPAAPPKPNPKGYECAPSDYVFWKDFRHSPARTWEEVTWVARLVYMGREEGFKRFKEKFKDVPLVHEPIGLDESKANVDELKKAKVWEIWDKVSGRVIWRAEGHQHDLDSKPDPLGLDGFFPCPKPLFATTTTDTLVPIADYLQYQDQAMELDELTTRIGMLVKAVKVVGVYDASQKGVERLMTEGVDNTLIPVDQWAAFAQAGGLKGVVDLLPLDMVVGALNELYKARDICKQVIYEVTGLSDIIRGASMASETATAQQIKSQFASLRLKEMTQDVARFATDLLNMKAQIMSDLYRGETLIEMSGIRQTEDGKYADAAIELLRNDSMRAYRIEIASDSMVELDEQAEKQSRIEFLEAAGGFLEKAVQAVQVVPQIAPLMGEMLMFGVRAYKASRPIEAAFEQAVQKLNEPQPPKPDPEQAKLQAQMQVEQVRSQANMQTDNAKLQANAQIEQMRAQFKAQSEQSKLAYEGQLEQARMHMQAMVDNNRQRSEAEQHALKMQNEAQLEQLRAEFADQAHQRDMDFQRWKAELEAATRIEVANIGSKAKVNDPATQAATREVASEVTQPDFTPLTLAVEQFTAAAKEMSRPRKRTLVRGDDGRPTGSIEEQT